MTAGNGVAAAAAGGPAQVIAGNSWGATAGGNVIITAGDGGGGGGAGDGGQILVTAGSPLGAGAEGGLLFLAGGAAAVAAGEGAFQVVSSPVSGSPLSSAVLLIDRAVTGVQAGSVVLSAGAAPAASGDDGGDASVAAGAGDGVGRDGRITLFGSGATIPFGAGGGEVGLKGSISTGVRDGGAILIESGAQTGDVALAAGDALPASGVTGGNVNVSGGASNGAIKGGAVNVVAGPGGATGDGGDITILGGLATGGPNVGGNVNIGGGGGPAAPGVVSFTGPLDPAAVGYQMSFGGSVGSQGAPDPGMIDPSLLAPGASGPTSFVVPFNAPFPGVPTNIQVTLGVLGGGPLGGAAPVLTYVVDVVTAGTFEIVFSGAPFGFGFYWKANL